MKVAMGYDRTAPKKAINVTVNEDLLRQVRALTRSLSGTLEDLLAAFVAQERARRRDEDEQVDRLILRINALHAEHGLLSSEFQDF
jgi:antitoxin CcdA